MFQLESLRASRDSAVASAGELTRALKVAQGRMEEVESGAREGNERVESLQNKVAELEASLKREVRQRTVLVLHLS